MFASRKAKLLGATAALSIAGLAVPAAAFAAPPPVTGTVNGTITVPTTLTLAVTNNPVDANPAAFNITTAAGVQGNAGDPTTPSGAPVVATVGTNDNSGYSLSQAITSGHGGDFYGSSTNVIPADVVAGWDYTSGPTGGAAYSVFSEGGVSNPISTSTTPSGGNGDAYYLGYSVTPPQNTPADTYSATITVTAIAS